MNKTISILLLSIIVSCSSSEQVSKFPKNELVEVDIIELAKEKFGDNYELNYNVAKDYVICLSNLNSEIPSNQTTSYFIYDTVNKTIISENIIRNGKLNWNSNYEIKIIEIPGIVQKDKPQEVGYIFNVKTNSKIKINGGVN